MQQNLFKKPLGKTLFFLGIISSVVILDQFLKHKIRQDGGFYLCNNGISFGIQFSNFIFWLTIALFSLFILVYYVFLYKKRPPLGFTIITLLGIALFTGGALSNLVDRFLVGCVLDYISLFKPLPVFNLADVCIFLGSCFMLLFLFLKNKCFS